MTLSGLFNDLTVQRVGFFLCRALVFHQQSVFQEPFRVASHSAENLDVLPKSADDLKYVDLGRKAMENICKAFVICVRE